MTSNTQKGCCDHSWRACTNRMCTSDLHTHHCEKCKAHGFLNQFADAKNPITTLGTNSVPIPAPTESTQPCQVFNKREWLVLGWWSEEELKNADSKGFIGTKYGVDCYISTFVPVTPPESTLAYCTTCVQMTNHGIGTNGGCLKCRVTTPPESKGANIYPSHKDLDMEKYRRLVYGSNFDSLFNYGFDVGKAHARTQLLQEIEGEVKVLKNAELIAAAGTRGFEKETRIYLEAITDVLTIIRNKQIP